MSIISSIYAYKFLRLITQNWKDTDAFKHGIIDAQGKVLKKGKLDYFTRLAFNIKKVLDKTAIGRSMTARYIVALALLKESFPEQYKNNQEVLLEAVRRLTEQDKNRETSDEYYLNTEQSETILQFLREDMTTTSNMDMSDGGGTSSSFAGCKVYDVDSSIFHRCRLGKKKYHRYSLYVGDDDIGKEIRDFAIKNPKSQIVIRDKSSKSMMYLRR